MSQEITLEQAAERAHQVELICGLMECCPRNFPDGDLSAITALLKRLSGDVAAWLIEELATREVPHG